MSLNYQELVLWGGEHRGEECRLTVEPLHEPCVNGNNSKNKGHVHE